MAAKNPFLESVSRLGADWLAEYQRNVERCAALAGEAARRSTAGAAGESSPQRLAERFASEAPTVATRLAEAGVSYYLRLTRSWAEATSEYLAAARQAVEPPGETVTAKASRPSLLFRGAPGERPANGFVVANTQSRAVEVGFRATELSPDDDGEPLEPSAQFTPQSCRLEPGSEQVVHCALLLSERFRPGVVYRGRIEVVGFPDMSIDISAEVDEAAPGPDAGKSATGEKGAARRRPASKKKTTKKKRS